MPFIEHQGRRILFLHIPKAGGSSVENWLGRLGPLRLFSARRPAASLCTPQHYRFEDIRALLGADWFDYGFTIVRNPYARIGSEYAFRALQGGARFLDRWPDFAAWLAAHLDRQAADPFLLDNHLRPQAEFPGPGIEVFRLEDGLEAALGAVAMRLGVPPPAAAPRINASAASPARIAWTAEAIGRVRAHYAADFAAFGYDPDAHPA